MLREVLIGAAAAVAVTASTAAFGQKAEYGSAAEAKAMLEKAVAALKANEADALAELNKADGQFRDRDLYVFCFEKGAGKFTSAPVHPWLMGTDIRALKEKDGSPLGQKLYDAAKEGLIATVDYNYARPCGTDPTPKETYITCVGDQCCGCGYWK